MTFGGLRQALEEQQAQLAARIQALDEAEAAMARLRQAFAQNFQLGGDGAPARDVTPPADPSSARP